MKKNATPFAILLFALILPAFVFLNVWQVFHHREVKEEIASLEAEQREWLEKNKRVLAGITVLSSPGRIDALAKELSLEEEPTGKVLHILFPGWRGKNQDG